MKKIKQILILIIALITTSASYAQIKITCLNYERNITTKEFTITLHWAKDTIDCGGAVTYDIFENNSTIGAGTYLTSTSDTSVTLAPTLALPKYIFVRSVKNGCAIKNSYSEQIRVDAKVIPSPPNIDSVSVNQNNKAVIGWATTSYTPVDKYYILRFDVVDSATQKIDTLNSGTTYYEYLNSVANNQVEKYSMSIYDGCKSETQFTAEFSTMHLQVNYDTCNRVAAINWTPYSNFNFGVSTYKLILHQNGKDSVLISTLDTNFVHSGLKFDTEYSYYVRAFEKATNKTSSSNRDTIKTQATRPLDNFKLRSVDIVDKVPHLNILIDDSSYYNYKVYRSEPLTGFIEIDTLPQGDTIHVDYYDETADTDKNAYKYMVVAYDSCGIALDSTSIHTTMFMHIESGDFLNNISWTNYYGNDTLAESIQLFRLKDKIWEIVPFKYTTSSDSLVVDSLRLWYESDNEFCYYAQALFETTFIKSNIACDEQNTLLFIPSALVANGKNEFKTIGSFIGIDNYILSIYNRQGGQIFETTDKNVGWKGIGAPHGAYIYYVQYQIKTGEIFERKGTVVLLR